jgi:hypothetical protein
MKLNFFNKKSQIDELALPEKPYEYKQQDLKAMDSDKLIDLIKKIEKYNQDIIKVFQSKNLHLFITLFINNICSTSIFGIQCHCNVSYIS